MNEFVLSRQTSHSNSRAGKVKKHLWPPSKLSSECSESRLWLDRAVEDVLIAPIRRRKREGGLCNDTQKKTCLRRGLQQFICLMECVPILEYLVVRSVQMLQAKWTLHSHIKNYRCTISPFPPPPHPHHACVHTQNPWAEINRCKMWKMVNQLIIHSICDVQTKILYTGNIPKNAVEKTFRTKMLVED